MGFNISQNKRRAAVLAATLGEFSDWTFIAECQHCRRRAEIPLTTLLRCYDEQMRIGFVIGRLRCSTARCRSTPSSLAIRNRLHEIVLVGTGAYG